MEIWFPTESVLVRKEFRKDPLGCYELTVHILGDAFSGFQIFSFSPPSAIRKCEILKFWLRGSMQALRVFRVGTRFATYGTFGPS